MALAVILVLVIGPGAAYLVGTGYASRLQADLGKELGAAAASLQQGRDVIQKAQTDDAPAELDAATADFRDAQSHFVKAKRLAHGDWLLSRAQGLPGIGGSYIRPRLAAVDGIADMGVALSDAGVKGVALERVLMAGGSGSGGQRLLEILQQTATLVPPMKADLDRAATAAARVDARLLPSGQRASFVHARSVVDAGRSGLGQFEKLTPALVEILGGNGKRTYLVEQMSNAELRAGGGFIGSYSILTADHGQLTISGTGDIGDVDYPRPRTTGACYDRYGAIVRCNGRQYIKPPPPMLEFLTAKSWVLGDSNYYPGFPANAQQAETFAPIELDGLKPDGVIAMDPYALAAILTLTGSVTVVGPPSVGSITVDATNVVSTLFEAENRAGLGAGHKSVLGDLAKILITRATTLPSTKWGELLKSLNQAVAQRHLQAFFNSPVAETAMDDFGWSGRQVVGGGDEFMQEVESNFGGTKANQFVTRTYDVELAVQGNELRHTVKVTLRNSMPAGKYEGNTYYRSYFRLYYPDSGTNPNMTNKVDAKQPTDEPLSGLKIIQGWQQINVDPRRGYGEDSVTFQYSTPLNNLATGHTIYWQKQPGTVNDKVNITFIDGSTNSKVSTDLGVDRIIRLTPAGMTVAAGQAGTAKLPSLTL